MSAPSDPFQKLEIRLAFERTTRVVNEFVHEVLYAFLSFHIQLQLENQETECKTESDNVIRSIDDILSKYKDEVKKDVSTPIDLLESIAKDIHVAPGRYDEARTSFKKLVRTVEEVKSFRGPNFNNFRRQLFGERMNAKGDAELQKEGFHRAYEKLRDELLGIVYALEDVKL